jgi:hypothetical protein
MVFCRCCGKEIHESAPTCPHCGGIQHTQFSVVANAEDGPVWVAILALIAGILCILGLVDDGPMDKDTTIGLIMLAIIGVVFGSISIKNQVTGKKMAIAGVVLSTIALLALVGMHSK